MDKKCTCGYLAQRSSKTTQPNYNIYGVPKPNNEIIIYPLSFNSINTTNYEPAMKVAKYHCNCKYLWLRELHGLSAFMMSNSLKEKIFWALVIASCAAWSISNTANILSEYSKQATTTLITILPVKQLKFPTLVLCPRNPDFFNYYNVLSDMYEKLGYLENETNFDILRYAITGFGFDNADSTDFNETYRDSLSEFYLQWRGNRSQYDMFDFLYNKNGYTCKDMFQSCYGGSSTFNCCDIFEPTYVMLRGKCFRLTDTYYQNDTDEVAKLTIFFNNMTSRILGSRILPQLVLYIGDSNIEVGLFPRYYLNSNDWNRLRFSQRSLKLLPSNERCSTEAVYQGKFTCFVYKWLMQLVNQYNCTVPYYKYKFTYLIDVPICDPSVVVNNFLNISDTPSTKGYKCTPACERIENTPQLTTSIDYDPDPSYMFRLEASFTYLEYEQYKEVRTTSTSGFISELGGQTGLFVGCSVMTIVQLINSIVVEINRKIHRYLNKKGIRAFFGLFTTNMHESACEESDKYSHNLETIYEVEEDTTSVDVKQESEQSKLDNGGSENFNKPAYSPNETSASSSSSGYERHNIVLESPEDVRIAEIFINEKI